MKTVKSSKDFKTMDSLSNSLKSVYKDTDLDYKGKYFKIKSLLNDTKEALEYDMARDELNTKITKQCRKIYLNWAKEHISEVLKPEKDHLYSYLNSVLNVDINENYCKLLLYKKKSSYCYNSIVVEKATIAEEIVELREGLEKAIFKTTIDHNAGIL